LFGFITIIKKKLYEILLIYLSLLYLFFGTIFLLIPLIYIELGRPRDLLKAGLNLFIGMLLLFKPNIFDKFYSLFLILITILFIFYLVEIFSIRWNQLTSQEKNKIKTIVELKKNVSTFIEAISLARKDFLNSSNILKFARNNENLNQKKWVRNRENDNIVNLNQNNLINLEMSKKATNQSKTDKMDEGKKIN